MAIFNSFLYVYQRVSLVNCLDPTCWHWMPKVTHHPDIIGQLEHSTCIFGIHFKQSAFSKMDIYPLVI
jgi:hypothetical protein